MSLQRNLYIAVGILTIAIGSAVLTEATLAFGGRGGISDGNKLHAVKVSPAPTKSPTKTPTPSVTPAAATPTATPVVTPAPAAAAPGAVTNGFVHLRSGASTSYPIVENLNAGTAVGLGSYVDSQWQEVTVGGVHGYIYKSYLNY